MKRGRLYRNPHRLCLADLSENDLLPASPRVVVDHLPVIVAFSMWQSARPRLDRSSSLHSLVFSFTEARSACFTWLEGRNELTAVHRRPGGLHARL